MKITYLSTADIPSRKANSVHIMKMCSAFSENNHEVILYAPKSEELADNDVYKFYGVDNKFKIRRIRKSPSRFGDYEYAIKNLLYVIKDKPELVFSRNLLSIFFASFSGIPLVLEIHQPISNNSRLQAKFFKLLIRLKTFKLLVVITNPLKEIYLNEYNLTEDKIFIAADGADLPRYGLSKRDKKNKNDKLTIGYVGHLYQGRGIELILELATRCMWGEFHIVGGTEEDINRVSELAEEIGNVIIHGFISPQEAEDFRLDMDILLAPYQEKVGLESGSMTTEKWMSPLKIFEYMAAGKPIICSNIPVLHEVLSDQKNCIFCEPCDVLSWEKALIKLNKNAEFRNKIGKQAKKDLEAKYLWKTRAANIIKKIV